MVTIDGSWRWWDIGAGGTAAFATEVDGECSAAPAGPGSSQQEQGTPAMLACGAGGAAAAWRALGCAPPALPVGKPPQRAPGTCNATTACLNPQNTCALCLRGPAAPRPAGTRHFAGASFPPSVHATRLPCGACTPVQACASSLPTDTCCFAGCRRRLPACSRSAAPARGRCCTMRDGCLTRRTPGQQVGPGLPCGQPPLVAAKPRCAHPGGCGCAAWLVGPAVCPCWLPPSVLVPRPASPAGELLRLTLPVLV